jgi:hypothetical protein
MNTKELIKPFSEYTSNKEHIEYLNRLKRIQERYINGAFTVSKKLSTKQHEKAFCIDATKNFAYTILTKINNSINHYEQIQH